MKSDPARHTAKSLLGLFSTAIVLAILHLISNYFKVIFYLEYVNYRFNSIIYRKTQHFIDIFIAELVWFYMRFGIPPGIEAVTQHGNCGAKFCKSRGIAERLITDCSCHYWSSRSDNLYAPPGGVVAQETGRGNHRAPITAETYLCESKGLQGGFRLDR